MNIMTDVMKLTYERIKDFEDCFKKSVTEPYGQRKLTEAEQWNMYQNLTPEQMFEMMQGMDYKQWERFNKWLYKMEQKEQNGRV